MYLRDESILSFVLSVHSYVYRHVIHLRRPKNCGMAGRQNKYFSLLFVSTVTLTLQLPPKRKGKVQNFKFTFFFRPVSETFSQVFLEIILKIFRERNEKICFIRGATSVPAPTPCDNLYLRCCSFFAETSRIDQFLPRSTWTRRGERHSRLVLRTYTYSVNNYRAMAPTNNQNDSFA